MKEEERGKYEQREGVKQRYRVEEGKEKVGEEGRKIDEERGGGK